MWENAGTRRGGTEKARLRARRQVAFYAHLGVYVISIACLALINLLADPDHPWFVWTLFGWGAAIVFHFLGTFVFGEGAAP